MYMYFLHIKNVTSFYADPQVVHMVKVLPANAGDARDAASIAGLGRSLGVGKGNPLQ